MLRILFLTVFISIIMSPAFAQDSTRKSNPVQSAVKPGQSANKFKSNKYHVYKYHYGKADSGKTYPASPAVRPQNPDSVGPAPAIDKSINGQYQYLLTKVYHYQQPLISALWKSASDTLILNRQKLKEAQNKLIAQGKVIDTLRIDSTANAQAGTSSRINEINMVGISMSLSTYNVVVWGLIIILGIITVSVIANSGKNRNEARYRTKLYSELEDEFKAYKTKANDKEKKLARELQTERNKLDELLGRG